MNNVVPFAPSVIGVPPVITVIGATDCIAVITLRDAVVQKELPMIAKIIRDEIWLEGERRRCAVSAYDPLVLENICVVVLRVGADLRRQFSG